MTDKVVHFPGAKAEDSPPEGIYEDQEHTSPKMQSNPIDCAIPYINTREGIWPMAALDGEQRRRMWHLWDMCDHLKRACMNATGDDDTTRALSHALKHLMGQLNYKVPEQ